MDLQILKEWAPTALTIIIPILFAIWRVLRKIEVVLTKVPEHEDRLEVHDQLASEVYGKPISSKLISENRQTYPVFHHRKLREDQ